MSVLKFSTRATRGVGLVFAGALTSLAAHGDVLRPKFGVVEHSRISAVHNEDGSLTTGPASEAVTTNWSGYVLNNFSTGQTYSSANASWTVQKAAFQAPPQTCHNEESRRTKATKQVCFTPQVEEEFSSSWVGIGGNCENANCTRTDNTLIQLGTEQDAAADGTTQYYAWYEMLPKSTVLIAPPPSATATGAAARPCRDISCAYVVKPGDAITASLACQTNCESGESQTWLLTMADATQKWTWSTTVTYRSTLASVEWIQEAPTGQSGVLPLADYGTATFDPTADGKTPTIANGTSGAVGPDAVMMVNPYGETSTPSPVAGLDVFSTCWGNNPSSVAACPAP